MSMRFNTPVFRPQDNKGRTLPGAQLFFYENYSTTPKTTYANVALTNPNPHPIIADGAGKFTDIFLGIGDYRVILTDRKGQILWDRNDVSTNDLTEDVINDIERQLDEVLNQYRMQYLGEYGVADPELEKTFTVPNAQYVEFNGFAYWTIPGTTLPYTTDSVTYPDPASDPNLTIAPNVTFAYVDTVTNLGDSQLAGGNIWPLSSQESAQVGDIIPSNALYLRDSLNTVIFECSELVSGEITALNITTPPYSATIGGITVSLSKLIKNRTKTNAQSLGFLLDGSDESALLESVCNSNLYSEIDFGRDGVLGVSDVAISTVSHLTLKSTGCTINVASIPTQTPSVSFGETAIIFSNCFKVKMDGWDNVDGSDFEANQVGWENCIDCGIKRVKFTNGGKNAQMWTAGCVDFKNEYSEASDSHDTGLSDGPRGFWHGNADDIDTNTVVTSSTANNNQATGIVLLSDGGGVERSLAGNNGGSGIITTAGSVASNAARVAYLKYNRSHNNSFSGIQSDSITVGVTETDIECVGNYCWLNDSYGIYLANTARWNVSNNHCWNNGATLSNSSGIHIENAKSVTGSGNHCFDTNTTGSKVQSNGMNITCPASQRIDRINLGQNNLFNNENQGLIIQTAAGGAIESVSVMGGTYQGNVNGVFIAEANPGEITEAVIDGIVSTGNTTTDLRSTAENVLVGESCIFETSIGIDDRITTSVTPSVKAKRILRLNYGSPSTLTNLLNGRAGQEMILYSLNANATIENNANIKTASGANVTLGAQQCIRLVRIGSVWMQPV